MKYECFVCGKKTEDLEQEGVLRKPVGWESDRCPKHRRENKPLVTLGELLQSKLPLK